VFKEAGLSTATIQREHITHAQVSNLFWINLGVSGMASLAMAISAPVIAWFFRQPPLVGISIALSGAFVLEGLAVQHMALLNRQMKFTTISAIEVGSAAGGFLIGIAMALLNWGYWSLVGATLATAALRVTAVWAVSEWRPQKPMRRSGTRPLVRFGADLTLVGIIYGFSRGFDVLLIGRFLGSDSVGLYSRASALLTRPIERLLTPIQAVIVSALSRLQTQPDRYRRAYLRVFEGLAIFGFIFTGLFLPLAHPVVAVMLGPQWEAAAPIFAGLSVAAVYLPLASATSWIYTSQGRSKELLLTAALGAAVMIASFIAGLPFGPTGVAISYAASGVFIQLPITFHIAGRRGPVSPWDHWRAFIRHLPLCVLVLAVTSLAAVSTAPFSPFARLLICVPAGLLAAAASILAFPATRQTATGMLAALNELRTPHPA
jgi:O-antigen/teichoic acid export membrane protein